MQEGSPPVPKGIRLRFRIHHNKDDLMKVLMVSALDGLPEIPSKDYPVQDRPQPKIVSNPAIQEMEKRFLLRIQVGRDIIRKIKLAL